MCAKVAFSIVITMLAMSPLQGQSPSGLPIVNDSGGAMELWVWKQQQPMWSRPPLFVPRGQTRTLDLTVPGPYFLMAREPDSLREFPIGWHDIHEKVRSNPKAFLSLQQVYESQEIVVRLWCRRCRSFHEYRIMDKVGKRIAVWGQLQPD